MKEKFIYYWYGLVFAIAIVGIVTESLSPASKTTSLLWTSTAMCWALVSLVNLLRAKRAERYLDDVRGQVDELRSRQQKAWLS